MKLLFIGCAILLLFVSQLSRACDKNVQYIKSGTVVNCDAWLVNSKTMNELTQKSDSLEVSQRLIEQQKQLIKLNNEEIEFYKVQSQSRAKELNKAESKQFWTGIGGFALGVVLTGLATKVAIEASK